MKELVRKILEDIYYNYTLRGNEFDIEDLIPQSLLSYNDYFEKGKKDILKIIEEFKEDYIYWNKIEKFDFNDWLEQVSPKEINKAIKFLKSMV